MMNKLQPKEKQLILLILLFFIPCLFAFVKPTPAVVKKDKTLSEALAAIEGYRIVKNTTLDEATIKFLDLDDYLFTTYEKDGVQITLFIGFYYTADKVSAAHSPLVCFPGQGWSISEPERGRQVVGNHLIEYAQIDAALGNQKELVVYWYQSHDDTTTLVYRNKLNTFYNNIVNGDQQHAFMRISISQNNIDPEGAKKVVTDFVSLIYPQFLKFIEI